MSWLFILSLLAAPEPEAFYRNLDGAWTRFGTNYDATAATFKAAQFQITFEDVELRTGQGFDDPMIGPPSRMTMMLVADVFAQLIQDEGSVDVLVQQSEFDGEGRRAAGSPLFPMADGIYGGFAFDHLVTGDDPAADLPDMVIKVDFGYPYHFGPDPPPPDRFDFFSVLITEMAHGLGMISLAQADGTSALETQTISRWDDRLHATHGQKLWQGTQFVANPASLVGLEGGVQYIGYRTFRSLGHFPRVNTPPVFDESSLSLWDPIIGAGAVLGPDHPPGTFKRMLLPFEVDALADLGYTVDIPRIGPRLDYQTIISAPSLYLTAVEVNGQWQTDIGLINRLDVGIRCILNAHTASGWLLAQSSLTLSPNGTFRGSVGDLFGELAVAIDWIRVQSERAITGYSVVRSVDGKQAHAVNGGRRLLSRGYIPHIAQDTQLWYTRVDVANARPSDTTTILRVGDQDAQLDADTFYSEDSFDVLQRFGGQLPPTSWAFAEDLEGRGSLTGYEVFGRIDGTHQSAGVEIVDLPNQLPRFRGRIYFPHIARDTAQFWTGFAFANVDPNELTFTLRAWGPDGALVGSKDITLQAGEKTITLVDPLLEGVGSPETVDWLEFEYERGLIGLELFGTHDGKRLAGLEAVVSPEKTLIFPVVDPTGWQGLAVTNVSQSPAQVQFHLRNTAGDVIGETEPRPLAPKQKAVFLLSDFFDLPAQGAGWVSATSDQDIIGFELVGTHDGEILYGLLAH